MRTKKFYNAPSIIVIQIKPSTILAMSDEKPEKVDLYIDFEREDEGFGD